MKQIKIICLLKKYKIGKQNKRRVGLTVIYTDIEGSTTHTGMVGNYCLGYSGGDTNGDSIGET